MRERRRTDPEPAGACGVVMYIENDGQKLREAATASLELTLIVRICPRPRAFISLRTSSGRRLVTGWTTSSVTTSTQSGLSPETAKLVCVAVQMIADIQTMLVDPHKTPRAEAKSMRKDFSEPFAAMDLTNRFTVIPSTK